MVCWFAGLPGGMWQTIAFFGAAQRVNAGRAPAYKRENAEYPQRILLKVEPRYVRAGFGVGSCA